jgi:hypothetical protein
MVVALACTLLSGCSMMEASSSESAPTPLTAVTAFGDFTTIDYCSLLDLPKVAAGVSAGAPLSSFESCQAELTDHSGKRAVMVGPLAFDSDPNIRPYDYSGPVPDGVSVQQSMFNDQNACTRAVTFADGIRLNVSVNGPGTRDVRCREADTAVTSSLDAVTGGKVGRLNFAARSWGRVSPCALLDVHELDAPSGPDARPAAGLSGHSCIRGKVSLQLSVADMGTAGTLETLGGHPARVNIDGAFCTVDAMQPAPGMPGHTEKAEISVVETAGTANDATCAAARTAASAVLPKLP